MRFPRLCVLLALTPFLAWGCGRDGSSRPDQTVAAAGLSTEDPADVSRTPKLGAEESSSYGDEAAEELPVSADLGYAFRGAERDGEPAPAAEVADPVALAHRLERSSRTEPSSRGRPNRTIQSGTLTAGSFDDVEHFDDFRKFLSDAIGEDAGERLPRLAIGRRVMIQVRNAQGHPVGGARVAVHVSDPQRQDSVDSKPGSPALVELVTGSDGRTMFLSGTDAPGSGHRFDVSVVGPGGGRPVWHVMDLDDETWTVTLSQAQTGLPRQLDLALVIDTTGSMGDELEYLKVEIDCIARWVYTAFPNVDQRFALVLYRDEGDQYVTRSFDFTGSLEEFRSQLAAQSAGGGGDYPEAMHLALEKAGNLGWRGGDATRVLFLVGDAPPHDRHAQRALAAVGTLRSRGVRVFPVASSGVGLQAEFVMRAAALLTLGQYLFLTDHSGVGLPHAEPHVPQYQVERLDRLMIRMIASELSGKRLAPNDVLAIERGGGVPGPVDILPGHQQPYAASSAPNGFGAHAARWIPSRWAILAALVVLTFGCDVWTKYRSG